MALDSTLQLLVCSFKSNSVQHIDPPRMTFDALIRVGVPHTFGEAAEAGGQQR